MPKLFSKASVFTLLLSGFLMIGSTTPTYAYARCGTKIHKAERNLEKAIRKHGANSVQAQRQREHLERVRQTCHR
ncbi:MAG TPA: hypothetical protein VJA94_03390 [Candidatus Angelobacter sp.]